MLIIYVYEDKNLIFPQTTNFKRININNNPKIDQIDQFLQRCNHSLIYCHNLKTTKSLCGIKTMQMCQHCVNIV